MPNERARQLRRDLTDAERRLWATLRDRRLGGYRFRRQYPVADFIVDFACTRHRLVVEADGAVSMPKMTLIATARLSWAARVAGAPILEPRNP
jgi:very-short-patch-repair endonuclease